MEVGRAGVQAEERRSARAGRDDDAAAEALERAQRVGGDLDPSANRTWLLVAAAG